nr:MAG TPA: hypothetical protein [Caudoviricetes sp.]
MLIVLLFKGIKDNSQLRFKPRLSFQNLSNQHIKMWFFAPTQIFMHCPSRLLYCYIRPRPQTLLL